MNTLSNAIGIIGMGWVGSSTAISILHQGICSRLLVNDIKKEIAEGEAMDLNHGSSFYPTADVVAASVEDMRMCRAIVITAGRGGRPGETRLDLLKENLEIVKSLSAKLKGYEGILIIVSNPVDVLTYFYQKYTGIPPRRIIGTGTMLETARLREMIGTRLNVDPKSIHAQVIGEHGDSKVVVWSKAIVGGKLLRHWPGWNEKDEEKIAEEVRTAASEIIKRKGATNHAIGLVTANLLASVFRNDRRILNVSTVISGRNGVNDVALSLPSIVAEDGVAEVLQLDLNEQEQKALYHSAKVLKKAIDSSE